MKHHIYISNSYEAEKTEDFYVESDKSMRDVVKAAAFQVIYDNDLSEYDVESIRFDAFQDFYGVLIQCRDFHISVWCMESKIPTLIINDCYFNIAEDIFDNMEIENGDPECGELFDRLYDREE